MIIDYTKPVQTREGHSVRILATDIKHAKYPIVGAVDFGDFEEVHRWNWMGECADHTNPDPLHLFNYDVFDVDGIEHFRGDDQ